MAKRSRALSLYCVLVVDGCCVVGFGGAAGEGGAEKPCVERGKRRRRRSNGSGVLRRGHIFCLACVVVEGWVGGQISVCVFVCVCLYVYGSIIEMEDLVLVT